LRWSRDSSRSLRQGRSLRLGCFAFSVFGSGLLVCELPGEFVDVSKRFIVRYECGSGDNGMGGNHHVHIAKAQGWLFAREGAIS